MQATIDYLVSQLTREEKECFDEWESGESGCDFIELLEGVNYDPQLIAALEEACTVRQHIQEYTDRMRVVKEFSVALRNLQRLPHWIQELK